LFCIYLYSFHLLAVHFFEKRKPSKKRSFAKKRVICESFLAKNFERDHSRKLIPKSSFPLAKVSSLKVKWILSGPLCLVQNIKENNKVQNFFVSLRLFFFAFFKSFKLAVYGTLCFFMKYNIFCDMEFEDHTVCLII